MEHCLNDMSFVLSIKLAVEAPLLLREQLLELFTASQVVPTPFVILITNLC